MMLRVVNSEGRPFNVRIIRIGEKWGRGDVLTHKATRFHNEPLVEFYDATTCASTGSAFGPRGQFVSRYYLSTLRASALDGAGVHLYGGSSDWWLDASVVQEAYKWVASEVTA